MDRRLDINLLPPEFQPQPALRWHPIYLALLYALSMLAVVVVGVTCQTRITKLEAQIGTTNENIARLQPFSDAYDMAHDSIKSLENLKQLFVYLDGQYVDWPLFFHHLKPNIPQGVWLKTVKAEVVTKAPDVPTPAPAPAPAPPAKGEKAPAAPATPPPPPPAPAPPLRTGDIVIEGLINGYSLIPLSEFLKNLQDDPYFVESFLQESNLNEDEVGVTRTFRVIVRVKDPKQTEAENAEKEKSKAKAAEAAAAAEAENTPAGEGAAAQ
jgi:hypothetical protein